jgi:hypothetical protein
MDLDELRRHKIPDVRVPTPEEAATYDANHEYFWLSPDRKSYTGKDHGAMLTEHKDLFGFTQTEVDRAREPVFLQGEMMDRYLHLYEVAIERGWICIILNKLARVLPSMPLAVFWFYSETPDVYDRIKAWLRSKGIADGVVKLKTIMLRTWTQPVQSLFAGTQFSKSGMNQTCPVCGNEVSADEMKSSPDGGMCSRCGNPLW